MVTLELIRGNGEKESVLKAVQILINQSMNIELFKENIISLLMDDSGLMYEQLDSKVKQAFTRVYN